ncbi:MAG: isochorismatase family protein [Pseudobdellovibrionaceae bacterium]
MIDFKIPTAFLIIDVQNVMFHGETAVYKATEALEKIKRLEKFASDKKVLTIYLQHDGGEGSPEQHGTEGWKLHPELSLNGPVVEKKSLDGISTTKLKSILDENQIKQLVICGMQSEFCIDANCRTGVKLGYSTYLIKDAHSTWGSTDDSALKQIERVNQQLEDSVTLVSTEDLLSIS